MEKYEIYKSMYDNLNKAMKNGFYYEAIFIEYAIFEDRLTAVLKYANVPFLCKSGRDINITDKIERIEKREEFSNKFVKERLTNELMQELRQWLKKRNELIHSLANIPYDSETVKKIADEGYELVKKISNKSKSVINHIKRYGI